MHLPKFAVKLRSEGPHEFERPRPQAEAVVGRCALSCPAVREGARGGWKTEIGVRGPITCGEPSERHSRREPLARAPYSRPSCWREEWRSRRERKAPFGPRRLLLFRPALRRPTRRSSITISWSHLGLEARGPEPLGVS